MTILSPPATKLEKALEIKILTLIKDSIEADMSFDEVLNVLERVRHLTTEIKIETGMK